MLMNPSPHIASWCWPANLTIFVLWSPFVSAGPLGIISERSTTQAYLSTMTSNFMVQTEFQGRRSGPLKKKRRKEPFFCLPLKLRGAAVYWLVVSVWLIGTLLD
jgi:hypothetical protein